MNDNTNNNTKLKYIPNILSAVRILLVPVFIYLFFAGGGRYIYAALCVFLIAGITDIVDGYLARRNNWITNLGKLLDPLADKLMQCSVLVCFAMKNSLMWWLAGLFIVKELFMICGAIIVLKKIKVTVKSHWYGKITTTVFYAIAILAFIFDISDLNMDGKTAFALFTPALGLAIVSMVMYIIDTLRINAGINAEKEKQEKSEKSEEI